jgi:hypothetical protein
MPFLFNVFFGNFSMPIFLLLIPLLIITFILTLILLSVSCLIFVTLFFLVLLTLMFLPMNILKPLIWFFSDHDYSWRNTKGNVYKLW